MFENQISHGSECVLESSRCSGTRNCRCYVLELHENSKNFFISNEKSIYHSNKVKSFENTHKLHKNSKFYLDVQNEFAPKLKLSWVVSDPTQT